MNSQIQKSLWRTGKDDYKKLMKVKLSKKSNFWSFFLGIIFTAIVVFPMACVVFQVIELYWFSRQTIILFLSIAWALLMFANGLSNYITIKMIKAYDTDLTDVQVLDDKAIWFYQTLNPGFGLFMLIVMVFFWMSAA